MGKNVLNIDSQKIAQSLNLQHYGRNIKVSKPQHFLSLAHSALKFVTVHSNETAELLNHNTESFVIASADFEGKLRIPHVLSTNPRLDFVKVLNKFFKTKHESEIALNAEISGSAKIGRNVSIGSFSSIGEDVSIGAGTIIGNNVVLAKGTVIGESCRIKSGSIIGEKGFGFVRDGETIHEFIHFGTVIIGNRVEIGALNTIVAGALCDTIIDDDVKTDDHVHIAHNVSIGKRTLITACAEVSGSVDIGNDVWIGPNTSLNNGITVGDGSFIGIASNVTKPLAKNSKVAGNPAKHLK